MHFINARRQALRLSVKARHKLINFNMMLKRGKITKLHVLVLCICLLPVLYLLWFGCSGASMVSHTCDQGINAMINMRLVNTHRDESTVQKGIMDCAALSNRNERELAHVREFIRQNPKKSTSPYYFILYTANCQLFKAEMGYMLTTMTDEEAEFPIAYSLIVYKDIEQVERLLRAIYQPQNYYCIHIDQKSSYLFYKSLVGIANCFDNIFLTAKRVNVLWGEYSVLEPEIMCMQELLKYKSWKYLINLTGQEFPLKTNEELVKILKAFNGSNNMEASLRGRNMERYNYVWNGVYKTSQRKESPPHKIEPIKGSVHIVASRGYVDYAVNNPVAKDLLEWVKNTGFPDETFFSTLNHNPHLKVPGSYAGEPESDSKTYPFLARYKVWRYQHESWRCGGKWVHSICVFGLADLRHLMMRPELFANKFYEDYEYVAYDCLEEWHYAKMRGWEKSKVDVKFYQNLPFVKNRVL